MEKNLQMIRGDTLAFGLEFEGLEQDLDSAYFTVKQRYDSHSDVIRKSIGSGITKISTGKYRVRVAPDDTASVTPGVYYYDCEVNVNNDTFTLLYGVLNILPDVS